MYKAGRLNQYLNLFYFHLIYNLNIWFSLAFKVELVNVESFFYNKSISATLSFLLSDGAIHQIQLNANDLKQSLVEFLVISNDGE